jgi:hypothetical protein
MQRADQPRRAVLQAQREQQDDADLGADGDELLGGA